MWSFLSLALSAYSSAKLFPSVFICILPKSCLPASHLSTSTCHSVSQNAQARFFFLYPSACIYSIKRHFEGKNISHVMAQAVPVDCTLPFVDGDSEWVFLPSACLSVAPDRSALQRRIKTLSRCQVSDMRKGENEDYRGSRWLRRQPHLVSEPRFTSEKKTTSC